jgi:hypothetical protein
VSAPAAPLVVRELWRFPVKSLGGEQLTAADVGEHGITGDRGWGLVDVATGNVLTARRQPELLFASARLRADGEVEIELRDGQVTDRSEDLSAWLQREVRLQRAGDEGGVYENPRDAEGETDWVAWQGPAHAWHDSPRARVSLVSAATIGDWDRRRFRANVVLDGAGEDELVGTEVHLGTTTLDVRARIARCVMVSRPQPGLDRDLDVLRTINRDRDARLAIGAVVLRTGRIELGDAIRL